MSLVHLVFLISIFCKTAFTETDSTCRCNMLGTMSNADEESICHKDTFECRCYPNVVGKNCDKCKEGYYNILSGKGCTECKCDPLGSHGISCHGITGKCNCKPGFTGYRCNHCQTNFFLNLGQCRPCNCNPYGSTDLQCNPMGQCECKSKAEGVICDHCAIKTFGLEQGCANCSPCYEFIHKAVNEYVLYVKEIEGAVLAVEDNLPHLIVDYKSFLYKIRELKGKIEALKKKYEESEQEYNREELETLMKESEEFHKKVVELTKKLNSDMFYKEVKQAVYSGLSNLNNANKLLGVCDKALKNATSTLNTLNKHNDTITDLAQEAMHMVDGIESEVETLYGMSLNVTVDCSLAKTLLAKSNSTKLDIKKLNKKVRESKSGIEDASNKVKGMEARINGIHNISQELLRKSTLLIIPATGEVKETISKIKKAGAFVVRSEGQLKEKEQKVREMQKNLWKKAESLQRKQAKVNLVLVEAEAAKKKAGDIVEESNAIAKMAEQTVFSIEKVKKAKKEAEKAMENIPKVSDKIWAVLNTSEEIKGIFTELLLVTENFKIIQNSMLFIAEDIKKNKFHNDINYNKLDELENQESKLTQMLMVHTETLKDIKRKTLKELKKNQTEIERDIKRMQEYVKILSTMPITDEQLDEVEKEINKSEEILQTINYLTTVKHKLKKQVKNVKDIIESIPIEDINICESAKSEPKTIPG